MKTEVDDMGGEDCSSFSVSMFGYADVGSQTGRPLTYMGWELNRRGLLNTVYARGIEQDAKYRTVAPIPVGRLVPRLMTGIGRLYGGFPHRELSERLFDYFAARHVSADKSDVHLHYLPGQNKSLRKAKQADTPVVVRGSMELMRAYNERHVEEGDKAGVEVTRDKWDRRRERRRERSFHEADHVLPISTFVERSLIDAGIDAEKMTVVPLGIDVADYPANEASRNAFSVVYLGSINLMKGIRYLLDAWEQLAWDDASLLLGGRPDPDIRPYLDTVPETVEMPGIVDPREVLSTADCFVFPSLSDGFGKAVLEAMASETPVVVSDQAGICDIVTDGEDGIVVPAGDAYALVDALTHLRDNPDERRRMGENARRTALQCTWERHVDLVVDAMQTTISD